MAVAWLGGGYGLLVQLDIRQDHPTSFRFSLSNFSLSLSGSLEHLAKSHLVRHGLHCLLHLDHPASRTQPRSTRLCAQSKMPRRRGEKDAEWLVHKDKIISLYMIDGLSLGKVMKQMETEEQFRAR